jgi:hypothetical protein
MKSLLTARRFSVVCMAWLLIPGFLGAQDFDIDWFAVSAGGNSSGGDFELSATIGPHDAGDMFGGDFAIIAGFWSVVAVLETPGMPSLSVTLSSAQIVVSWPENGSQGFALEETPALANSSWSAVNAMLATSNGTNSVRLPLPAGNRFYRLSKP